MLQQPSPAQAPQVQTVVTARWVARAETRGLRIGIWVLILGSLLLPRPAGAVVGAVNLLVIVGHVGWSSLIAARARRELAQADPARLSTVFEQLRALPGPRRTFEALHTALAGGGASSATDRSSAAPPATTPKKGPTGQPGIGDGLTCYERGSHVPGCPHHPLDGPGLL